MSIGIKPIIGIVLAGSGVTALSYGGYALLSKEAPKTIKERLKNKTPLKFYSGGDTDNNAKAAWTTKMTAYKKDNAPNIDTNILSKENLNELTFSNKCKEILAIKWDKENEELKGKETWASNWCFNQT